MHDHPRRWLLHARSLSNRRCPARRYCVDWIRLYPALSGTGPVTNTVSTLPQHDREHADQLPLGLDLAGPLGSLRPAAQSLLPFEEPARPSAIVPGAPLQVLGDGALLGCDGRGVVRDHP